MSDIKFNEINKLVKEIGEKHSSAPKGFAFTHRNTSSISEDAYGVNAEEVNKSIFEVTQSPLYEGGKFQAESVTESILSKLSNEVPSFSEDVEKFAVDVAQCLAESLNKNKSLRNVSVKESAVEFQYGRGTYQFNLTPKGSKVEVIAESFGDNPKVVDKYFTGLTNGRKFDPTQTLYSTLSESIAKQVELAVEEAALDGVVAEAIGKLTMSKTYQVVTPESAEHGDAADHGFEYEDQEFDSIEDLADEIQSAGSVEASSYPVRKPYEGTWFSSVDPDLDYQDGSETTYSFHPEGLSDEQWEELFGLLGIKVKAESKIAEREGTGFVENYPDLAKKLKVTIQKVMDKVDDKYTVSHGDDEPQEVEHKSRDGFISSNDGGYEQAAFVSALNLHGYKLPQEVQDAIDSIEIPEGEDEELPDDEVMFQVKAFVDFKSGPSWTVQGAINWEHPYFRPGKGNEVFKEIEVEFDDLEDMKKNFNKVLVAVAKCGKFLMGEEAPGKVSEASKLDRALYGDGAKGVKPYQVLSVWDNGGKTADQYTIVLRPDYVLGSVSDRSPNGLYASISVSPSLSVSNFGDTKLGRHLGKKISFDDLPKKVQDHVIDRLSAPIEEEDEFKKLDVLQMEIQKLMKSGSDEDWKKAMELKKEADALFSKLYDVRSMKEAEEEDLSDMYEIVDMGWENPSYFQGFGTFGSKWDDSTYAVGYNIHDAVNELIGDIGQLDISEALMDAITADLEASLAKLGKKAFEDWYDHSGDERPEDGDEPIEEMMYHIGVRVKKDKGPRDGDGKFDPLAAVAAHVKKNSEASESKSLSTPDKHQLKILKDTVKNPEKSLLGGHSAEEAKALLKKKFKYTDQQIADLEKRESKMGLTKEDDRYLRFTFAGRKPESWTQQEWQRMLAGVSFHHNDVESAINEVEKILKDQQIADLEKQEEVKESSERPKVFGYYINRDERGEFGADVRDESGETVWETDGEVFEDGFMKNKSDIAGLEKHLVSLGIMKKEDQLMGMREFEEYLEGLGKWIIHDWAGNHVFRDQEFETFDDAEAWLDEKLGDDYETDRQEYEIIKVESKDPSSNKKVTESVGSDKDYNYAVKIDGVSSDFYKAPFGRQIDDLKKIKEFQSKAKKDHIGSKGKATLGAVKAWIKSAKPKQYFARWKKDSSSYKDDSVEIFYMDGGIEEAGKFPHMGFDKLAAKLKRKGVDDPEALAASILRKKYGKKTFQAAAAAGRKKQEAAGSDLERDIYALSSGTIATLTGLTKAHSIELFQVAFANWAHKNGGSYKNWVEAFHGYMNSVGVELVKSNRGHVADRESFKKVFGDIFESRKQEYRKIMESFKRK